MSKTAIYSRVSTDKQSKGLEAQRRVLDNFCYSKGIKKYLSFQDFNVSGAKSNRPELDKLMEQARSGEIDQIIVYSFSRFARSTTHLLRALDEFQKLGIEFISISENIETSTPMGKGMFTIVSAISQLERELISERVKVGLDNAKAKGKQIGRPKTRPSELIKELHNQGMTYRQIAKLTKCLIATISNELREVS